MAKRKVPVGFVSGKGGFIRRKHPDGRIEQICSHVYNSDLTVGGCNSQVPVCLMKEVIENNGEYAPGKLREYRKQDLCLDNRCDYCFGKGTGRGNWGKTTPRVVDHHTRKHFERERPKVVRVNKVTEGGHPMYIDTLLAYLDLCEEFGTQVIFIDKMLPYGRQGLKGSAFSYMPKELIAKVPWGKVLGQRFIDVGGVAHYSLGWDRFERGVVEQGFTNQWRTEQSMKYFKQGMNTTNTVVCEVTSSIEENIKMGSAIYLALEAREKIGIPIRIIPVRINSARFAFALTGKSWEELAGPTKTSAKKNKGFRKRDPDQGKMKLRGNTQIRWRYKRRGNNDLDPMFMHDDFKKLLDQGVGFCGRIGNYEYCDKCNLEGDTRIVFPVSQLAEVVYKKDRKNKRRGNNRPKKKQNPEPELDL